MALTATDINAENDGWGFGPAGDQARPGADTLLTGWPAPSNDGYLVVPGAEFWGMQPQTEDDPVRRADTMRERAGAVFKRQRAVGAFSRELDDLFTTVAEDRDWSKGLEHFDRSLAELRRKHADGLEAQEDREAFERHAGQFGAMQRIGLKRTLVERQQADALVQLDEQLAYYAGKAATAPNDVFRSIAVDSGLQAIAELREAGYLFPEAAQRLETAFRGRLDGADLESIVKADPENALTLLDDMRLFPNANMAIRGRLKDSLLRPAIARSDDPPPEIRTADYRPERDGVFEIRPLANEATPEADAPPTVTPPDEAKAATPAQAPSGGTKQNIWQQLTIQLYNSQQAARQGLHAQDLENAKPLPDELSKFNPEPRDSEDTVRILYKQATAAAEKLGTEIAFRFDPRTGEPQFVLRPESSLHVASGDGFGATFANRIAEIANGFGQQLGLANVSPLGGAAAIGNRAANAAKTGRAFDEATLSSGGAGGPTKTGPSATTTAAAATESAAAKPAITVTGKELGDFGSDLSAWRKAATDAYNKLREGGPAHHPELGEVAFTGAGRRKFITTAPEAEKLKLVVALREIIENGKVTGTEPARAGRTDGIVKVHWVVADVTLEGKTRAVAVNVGEDARGKKFYNLNPDASDFAKSAPPGTILPAIPGAGINLLFLDAERSKAEGDER